MLGDVLTGAREPGGRLPTTWPVTMADVPVMDITPQGGVLRYEGIHVGYRAWLRARTQPAYPFGFGLGYTSGLQVEWTLLAWRRTALAMAVAEWAGILSSLGLIGAIIAWTVRYRRMHSGLAMLDRPVTDGGLPALIAATLLCLCLAALARSCSGGDPGRSQAAEH